MTGEKLGEPHSFNGSKSLLNMTLCPPYHIELGCFIHQSHHHGPRHTIHIWGNATNPSHQCRYMFKRCCSAKSQPCPIHCHTLSFIHFMTATLNHTSQFVFTSSQSLAPFRVTDVGFIKALLWRIAPCRHQLIIQGVDLGTPPSVLWSLHASMASFSLPATGIHQWPSTRRFCMVVDAKSFIPTMWIVLLYLEGHHPYRWFLSRLLTVYIIDR